MYRTTIKSVGFGCQPPVNRIIVIEFTHCLKIKTAFGSRPGTICKVYQDDPTVNEKEFRLEDLEVLHIETVLLQGKFENRFHRKTRTLEKVWIGDNFNRRNGRQISVGLAAKHLGADHKERKRLQKVVK